MIPQVLCFVFLIDTFLGRAPTLRYLNALKNIKFSSKVICSIPFHVNQRSLKRYTLLHLLPDRFIYLHSSSGSLSKRSTIEFPIPITQPLASLLEPLIANALSINNDALLRQVIDKFGRKLSNLPHLENEGIGCSGKTIYK